MSNYPPGVTGTEPQIVGHPDDDNAQGPHPALEDIVDKATALMKSVRTLNQHLPDGVMLLVHVNVDGYEPGVKVGLHTKDASPAAIDWLQMQVSDIEIVGPYGKWSEGRQIHVEAKLSAELTIMAYQSGLKGGRKKQ